MITWNRFLSKICPGDCFMSLDLKDHFHIQVAPHHRRLLIHIRRGGISIQGPAVWAVSGSPHFYTMHGYGSLPSETDGNPYTQLPQRLAHSGPVAGVRVIAAPRPIPLRWDLLSQVNGTIWHPRPELWALHVSRREPFGLPERVLNTMAGARADAGRLRGARRMNPQCPCTVPPWDLPTVPMALKGPMFEPLQSLSLRVLSVKTSLQVGDLQALSINPACLEFGPNDSKVVLKLVWAQKQTKTTLGYVPKVLSTPFRAQVIPLSASPPPPPSRWAARNPCAAPSGPWKFTLNVLPFTKSQNSFLLASVTALKVALLRSRTFLGG